MKNYWIYFVRAGDKNGAIKIGRSLDPRYRVQKMQINNHERLSLLAATPGSAKDEFDMHKRFEYANIHSEWFKPVPELLMLIAAVGLPNLAKRKPDPDYVV